VGHAAVTPAFGLDAKFVIHTVGPVWQGGGYGEGELLRSCYDRSLELAAERGCRSVAFPLISSGNYGFPKDRALQVAISAFSAFLMEREMEIFLVVFDQRAYRLSEQLFRDVESYIDQHFVDVCEAAVYGSGRRIRRRRDAERLCEKNAVAEMMPCAMPSLSLDEFLKARDAGFTEKLRELIARRGMKNSAVYKRANISKQHFSKLINDPDARPTKPTAIALALALELNLEDTRDLIGRAGYALTGSSTFDLIIQYFIERKQYNVVEINIALYEFDQSLLGS
jgi:DNA-binding phage protein